MIKIYQNTMTAEEAAELSNRVAQLSGFVKMMTGVANNCAYAVMMDALDHIRKHPLYADKKIKRLFEGNHNSVLDFYKRYRNRLRWPNYDEMHFFSVKYLSSGARKKFGDPLTDEQYFEFWEATGNLVYQKSRQWVTSLWNKYRLSLIHHDVEHPEIVAWGLVGQTVLGLAVETYERTMRSTHEAVPELSMELVKKIFSPFSMEAVAKAWRKAFLSLAPTTYKLDEIETSNIAYGVNQLRELWVSPDLPFDATIAAVEDYQEDIFRTAGQAKKSIRELKEMRDDAVQDIEQQRREARLARMKSKSATVASSSEDAKI